MRSRGLNKRIELWNTVPVKDGAGGSTNYDQLISSSWAKVETAKATASKLNEIGLDDLSEKLLITVRFRNDLPYNGTNQFIMYRGLKYSFILSPMDVNFSSSFVKIIATRNIVNSVAVLEPINPDSNTIYVNYKNRVEGNNGLLSSEQCTLEYIEGLT